MNFQGDLVCEGGENSERPMKFITISQYIPQLQPDSGSWLIELPRKSPSHRRYKATLGSPVLSRHLVILIFTRIIS